MDAIPSWEKMYRRMFSAHPEMRELLAQIHSGSLEELIISGSLLAINGETQRNE